MKLFVYGTLRKGQSNHELIKEEKLISDQARMKAKLYDTGNGYPALVLKGKDYVYGEIYDVNDSLLPDLDLLEGYDESRTDNLYFRVKKMIETNQELVEAWVYVIDKRHENSLKELIPFQDWSVYKWYETLKTVKYFAYGSCMDVERIEQAGMKQQFSNVAGVGTLSGYTMDYLISREDGGRADIKTSCADEYVEGIIYSLAKEAVDYLFHREGVHTGNYRPVLLTVETEEGPLFDVLSFTVVHKESPVAPPNHYSTEILRGAKGRLSYEYYKKLESRVEELLKESDRS